MLLMLISDKLHVKCQSKISSGLYNTRGCVVCQFLRASNTSVDIGKGKGDDCRGDRMHSFHLDKTRPCVESNKFCESLHGR